MKVPNKRLYERIKRVSLSRLQNEGSQRKRRDITAQAKSIKATE